MSRFTVVPLLGLLVLAVTWGRDLPPLAVAVVAATLAAAVLVSVHHAEVVAHRVGEPYGSLVLAVAVTVIEVGLIVTLMLTSANDESTLARDTVFAAVMITCNGIAGLCLLVGALRHGEVAFQTEGARAALSAVLVLATLSLVLPSFTTSSPGPTFTGPQLAFAAVASLAVYGTYVFVQTVRHRDYFLPAGDDGADPDAHAAPPSSRAAWTSLVLLLVSLVVVVGLAKTGSPAIRSGVDAIGAPAAFVGVVIALLVLLPESLAAVRAARRNLVQTSLNLALGSALASIGLTIPVIALATIWVPGPLVLGLGPVEMVLLALTAAVGILTVSTGRATVLQGGIHLAVFAAFMFTALVP